MSITVLLVGAKGKMGRAITEVLLAGAVFPGMPEIIAVDPRGGDYEKIEDVDLGSLSSKIDVVINFTNPECTLKTALWCADQEKPLVTGTTGLSEEQQKELLQLANVIPIVWAPNMSLGVNVIDALLPELAKVLKDFKIEIVETHHDQKKDSPSGTAERFAKTLQAVKGGNIQYGRKKGFADSYPKKDIVIHALRGGTVPGTHEIHFLGPDEEIVITHRAGSRKIFANGAVLVAQWIIQEGRLPGLYTMNEVLGIDKE